MDGRATAGVAAFFIDYEDRAYQILTPNPNGPGLIEGITNVGDTDQKGLELEFAFLINEYLTVTAAAGFIDAEWDAGTVMPDGTDLSGRTPSNVIDDGFSITADLNRPISDDLTFLASLQFSHQGQGESMPPFDPITNEAYSVLNLQAGFQKGPWELMLNVDNVTDEEYYTDLENFPNFGLDGLSGEGPATIVIGTFGHPRIVSASLTYSF
jgi:iron complex outermembrane receptor protein